MSTGLAGPGAPGSRWGASLCLSGLRLLAFAPQPQGTTLASFLSCLAHLTVPQEGALRPDARSPGLSHRCWPWSLPSSKAPRATAMTLSRGDTHSSTPTRSPRGQPAPPVPAPAGLADVLWLPRFPSVRLRTRCVAERPRLRLPRAKLGGRGRKHVSVPERQEWGSVQRARRLCPPRLARPPTAARLAGRRGFLAPHPPASPAHGG